MAAVPDSWSMCTQVKVVVGIVMLGTRGLQVFAWSRFKGIGPITHPLCLLALVTMIRTLQRGGKARQYGALDLHCHSGVAGDEVY